MTQYLLSVHHDYDAPFRPDMEQIFADVDAFNQTIADVQVFGGGLEAPHTATTVANHDGQIVVTDGPFAETKEALGGFWVIDVPDLDAALEIAGRATTACRAPIEVRPFESE
ncbi:YciI family protein [Demequina sp.]|uniref:YciI family protein n=1 Tax=Demequina sp. TaxID=2050685 RepID=UPI003D0AEB5B